MRPFGAILGRRCCYELPLESGEDMGVHTLAVVVGGVDSGRLVPGLVAAGFAALAFFYTWRWIVQRRTLRQRGIPVEAEITRVTSTEKGAWYTVSFTTNDGQVVTRKRSDEGPERVTQWVFDPERPKTAWLAHQLQSRWVSFGLWATFGLGVLLTLFAFGAITSA